MSKGFILTPEFLNAEDVMPVEGDRTDYTKPSVYDIPTEVDVDVSGDAAGEVVFRFAYPDREEPTEAESPLDETPDVFVRRGRYSGKLMALRTRPKRELVSSLAERLRVVAPRQKRKNQQLNFMLLSNILRKKQDELLAV